MATYKVRRFSLRDLILVLGVCAFPIFTWSLYYFFERLPAWLYYLDLWEIVGIFAYTQLFALVESVTILLTLALAAVLLPVFFRGRFVAVGSVLVLFLAGIAMLVQREDNALRALSPVPLLIAAAIALTLTLLLVLIYRRTRVQSLVEAFAERVSVLLYLYLPISLIGLVVVVIRNMG
ncbi:MAG: hypothetical protein KDE53_39000 [Caldilineaceae bacterium]|nr:hypothetical protein [Caldilineaceae bacterium]